jgi:hypothetical protein
VLIGLGFAVKVTAGLAGLGIAIALWRQLGGRQLGGRRLAGVLGALAAGFAVVAAAALATGGTAMIRATSTASDMVSIG